MQEFENVYDLDMFRQGKYDVNRAEVYSSRHHRVTMWTVLQDNTLSPPTSEAERLLIVMGGMGEYRSGVSSRMVDDGAMIVVPPGAGHEIRNVGISPLVVLSIEGHEK